MAMKLPEGNSIILQQIPRISGPGVLSLCGKESKCLTNQIKLCEDMTKNIIELHDIIQQI